MHGLQPGAPKSREHDFPKKKKNVPFLNFVGPVTPPWVLYPSEIMNLGCTERLLARAVFTRSIRVHGWQPGSQNPGSTIFRKNVLFLKFIGLVKPLWVLYSSEIMYRDSTGSSLVRSVFARSIKVLGWQPGAPKFREHDFPKKKSCFFFNFIGPVTPPWVMYPSEIMHMGSTERLLARTVFAKSIKVLGWQPETPKSGSTVFRKNADFFEIHWTSDSSVGSAALPNHAYGLYGTFTSKSGVYKVN